MGGEVEGSDAYLQSSLSKRVNPGQAATPSKVNNLFI